MLCSPIKTVSLLVVTPKKAKKEKELENRKEKINYLKMDFKVGKKKAYKKIAKDRKVIPDPIDDRKFQE